jgi:hypothetical protein
MVDISESEDYEKTGDKIVELVEEYLILENID